MVLRESIGDEEPDTPNSIVAYLRRKQSAAHSGSIEDDFEGVGSGTVLGKGLTANVHIIKERGGSGLEWACKEIPLQGLSQSRLEALREEITILRDMDHPNIIRIREVVLAIPLPLDPRHGGPEHSTCEPLAKTTTRVLFILTY